MNRDAQKQVPNFLLFLKNC